MTFTSDAPAEFIDRCIRAADSLATLAAENSDSVEAGRLASKADGVLLALSYAEEMFGDGPTVPLELFSRALDEIYGLRRALAYEAGGIEAHLSMKSFPKSRRLVAEGQIERMRLSARGKVEVAYAGKSSASLRSAFRQAGAKDSLTRGQWEAEQPVRGSDG